MRILDVNSKLYSFRPDAAYVIRYDSFTVPHQRSADYYYRFPTYLLDEVDGVTLWALQYSILKTLSFQERRHWVTPDEARAFLMLVVISEDTAFNYAIACAKPPCQPDF